MDKRKLVSDAANDPTAMLLVDKSGEVILIVRTRPDDRFAIEVVGDCEVKILNGEDHDHAANSRRYMHLRRALVERDVSFVDALIDILPEAGEADEDDVDEAFDVVIRNLEGI